MTDHHMQTIQSLFIVFVCMCTCICLCLWERERERIISVCLAKRLVAMMNHCHGEPPAVAEFSCSLFSEKMILKVDCGRKYVRRSLSFFLWVLDALSCTFVHSCGSLWFECKYPAVPGDKKFNNVMQATRRFHWKFVRFWINFSKNRSQARSGERLYYNDLEMWTSYN